jgi:1-acyl-sn-glycerol-3-phosphate acyltransferase
MTGSALASVSRLLAGTTVEWRCDAGADVQRIYFANHASHLDFLVVWSLLPARLRQWARPVAGRDYWEQGAIRRWLAGRVFNAVLIDSNRIWRCLTRTRRAPRSSAWPARWGAGIR